MKVEDPLVQNLAQVNFLDPEYLGLMSLVERRVQPKYLPSVNFFKDFHDNEIIIAMDLRCDDVNDINKKDSEARNQVIYQNNMNFKS